MLFETPTDTEHPAISKHNASAGNGILFAAMRAIWPVIRFFVRLHSPATTKKNTKNGRPAVSSHEASQWSFNCRL